MEDSYGIAAFPSRQQVYAFHQALRQAGVGASIVTTPRRVSLGCGLSVRFDLQDEHRVREVYRTVRPGNLIGFFRVIANGSVLSVYPL